MPGKPPPTPSRGYRSATGLGLESRLPQRAGTQSDGTPRPVEGDVTPRPAEIPPDMAMLSIPAKLRALEDASMANSRAIAYEQDQRNEARRHGESIATLNAFAERVEPALVQSHKTATVVDDMRRDVRDMKASVDTLIESQARDDERRISVDEKFDRVIERIGAIDDAGRRNETAASVLSTKVDTLDTKLAAAAARQNTADNKIATLEKHGFAARKIEKLSRRDVAVGGLGLGGLVGGLIEIIKLIAEHWPH